MVMDIMEELLVDVKRYRVTEITGALSGDIMNPPVESSSLSSSGGVWPGRQQ